MMSCVRFTSMGNFRCDTTDCSIPFMSPSNLYAACMCSTFCGTCPAKTIKLTNVQLDLSSSFFFSRQSGAPTFCTKVEMKRGGCLDQVSTKSISTVQWCGPNESIDPNPQENQTKSNIIYGGLPRCRSIVDLILTTSIWVNRDMMMMMMIKQT